ncbi:MAG: Bor family protein [Myxococcota bacterium]|nr:Bor family protein [Myxococcota bacterium]
MSVSRPGLLLLLLAACTSGGCASGAATRIRVDHYVFGLAAGRSVDVRDVCASGQADSLELTRTFGDYAWSVVTLGFYLPHHVEIACVQETAR